MIFCQEFCKSEFPYCKYLKNYRSTRLSSAASRWKWNERRWWSDVTSWRYDVPKRRRAVRPLNRPMRTLLRNARNSKRKWPKTRTKRQRWVISNKYRVYLAQEFWVIKDMLSRFLYIKKIWSKFHKCLRKQIICFLICFNWRLLQTDVRLNIYRSCWVTWTVWSLTWSRSRRCCVSCARRTTTCSLSWTPFPARTQSYRSWLIAVTSWAPS